MPYIEEDKIVYRVIFLRRREPEVCKGESIPAGWQASPVDGWVGADRLRGGGGILFGRKSVSNCSRDEAEREIGLHMLFTEYSY